MQPTFFNIAAAVFLCMGFLKFMLLVPLIPIAFATMMRVRARHPELPAMPPFVLATMLIVFSASYSFFSWPLVLRREKMSFFCFYSPRTVMRDVLRTYRNLKT